MSQNHDAFLPFRTPVRGHAFAARPADGHQPAPRVRVTLRREPDNPRDPYAVAVWVEEGGVPWRIGYLERAVAARLAPRLDEGRLAVAGEVEGWLEEPGGRWERPVVRLRPAVASTDTASLAAEDRGIWGRPPASVVRPVERRRAS